MILGGSCQKILNTSTLLIQADKVNPQKSWDCKCMLMLVIMCFYSYLKFSKNTITLYDIRTKDKVLEKDSPIISCLLVLIAWWLYNLGNILRCTVHNLFDYQRSIRDRWDVQWEWSCWDRSCWKLAGGDGELSTALSELCKEYPELRTGGSEKESLRLVDLLIQNTGLPLSHITEPLLSSLEASPEPCWVTCLSYFWCLTFNYSL